MLKRLMISLLCSIPLAACTVHVPDGVTPIDDFALQPYLGRWYEIARLDHKFERGLSRVTAEYSMRDDGGIKVLNRGYEDAAGTWDDAEGRAYFVEDATTGYLKVSFFGPFYGAYIIVDHDPAAYSLVSGPDRSYLWLLSRTPTLPAATQQRLLAKARELGFDTDALIFVDQSASTD
jgi:apolipoprotein D and lipocalin family protein